MAITLFGTQGATYVTTTSISPASIINHNPNDMILLFVGTKPDTATPSTPSGYNLLGTVAGGTGTTGIDTGPTRVSIFYRIATGSGTTGDLPGTITVTGNNVSFWNTQAYSKSASASWDIVGVGAADTTTGTAHTVTMPSDPGMTVGDFLVAIGVIPTDVGAAAQFSAEQVSAAGMTTVSLTERLEYSSASGQDIGGWLASAAVVTGTSTGVPTVSATAGGTTTNVAGPIYLIRLREITVTTVTASDSMDYSFTESGSAVQVLYPTLTDVKTASSGRNGANPTVNLNVNQDDIIVVKAGTENIQQSEVTAMSGGGLVWTKQAEIANTAARAEASLWTAKATSTTTITITPTFSSATMSRSIAAESWGQAKLATTPATNISADDTNAQSSITSTAASSIISWASVDFNAIAPGTPTYVDSPTLDVAPIGTAGTDYMAYYAYQQAANAGAQAYGITSPTGQSANMVAIEIQSNATGGGATPITGSESMAMSFTEATQIDSSSTGTESMAVTFTESRALDSTSSSSESLNVSLAESSAVSVVVPSSETLSVSLSESSSLVISSVIVGGETMTATLGEVSAIASTVPVSETFAFTFTESRVLSSTSSSSENLNASLTESGGIASTSSSNDAFTLSLTESSSVVVTVASSETMATSISESNSFFKAIDGAETLSVSMTESNTAQNSFSSSENLNVSMADASSGAVNYTTTDTLNLALSEAIGLASTSSGNDAGTISLTEQSSSALSSTGTDSLAVAFVEASSVAVVVASSDSMNATIAEGTPSFFMQDGRAGFETFAFTLTESSTVFKQIGVNDTMDFSISDTSASFRTIASSENLAVSLTELGQPVNQQPTTDSMNVSMSETSDLQVFGTISKSAIDTMVVSILDVSSPISAQFIKSDGLNLSMTESATLAGTASVSDTINVSLDESALISITPAGSDVANVSLAETSSLTITEGTHGKVWNGSAMVDGRMTIWDGTKFVDIAIKVWNGSNWV